MEFLNFARLDKKYGKIPSLTYQRFYLQFAAKKEYVKFLHSFLKDNTEISIISYNTLGNNLQTNQTYLNSLNKNNRIELTNVVFKNPDDTYTYTYPTGSYMKNFKDITLMDEIKSEFEDEARELSMVEISSSHFCQQKWEEVKIPQCDSDTITEDILILLLDSLIFFTKNEK